MTGTFALHEAGQNVERVGVAQPLHGVSSTTRHDAFEHVVSVDREVHSVGIHIPEKPGNGRR